MSAEQPTGERVSPALTEARTVLSRAETACEQLDAYWVRNDPDAEAIRAALEVAIEALAPFRRTRRKARS